MQPFVLAFLLPALAAAAPAAKRDETSPTLITFSFAGELVTATYYGTATSTGIAPCPTETFTYEGAVITVPYTGPGTPQSCLTSGESTPKSTPTAVAPVSSVPVPTTSTSAESVPTTPVTASAPIEPTSTISKTVAPTSSSSAVPKGFNYGSSGMTQSIFETQFNLARDLVGTSGFTSARLYTMIQDGTTNGVISAIPAAIATKTQLLLGLFYPNVDNELAALAAAIDQYGSDFADLVLGISVGSEDLYRDSIIGIENHDGIGATPDEIVSFIQSTRNTIAGTVLSSKLVGHVDTWTAYVNSSNEAVITASDFLGMDAYPYYQNTENNAIGEAQSLFESAYKATVAVAQSKPVWITETGYPVSGPTEGDAVASVANSATYWQQVGCDYAFDKIPTFWYDLVDEGASPSFGVTDGTTTPLFDLTCSS